MAALRESCASYEWVGPRDYLERFLAEYRLRDEAIRAFPHAVQAIRITAEPGRGVAGAGVL